MEPATTDLVSPPDAKALRTLLYHCEQLFTDNSWLPPTMDNYRRAANVLSKEINLPDERQMLLSDSGYRTLLKLVLTFHESCMFGTLAGYGDYYTACKKVVGECIQAEVKPGSGQELADLVARHIQTKIDTFLYVVPLLGLELKGVRELRLGPYRVCRPGADILKAHGVDFEGQDIEHALKVHEHYLWLIGAHRGTEIVAQEQFRNAADQVAGFLSMYVGVEYERGGIRFAFQAAMAAEELPNRSTWLSCRVSDKKLSTTWKYLANQILEVDAGTADALHRGDVLQYCFSLPAKEKPTELERALLRAAIWLQDASHERRDAMRLLKLWSCAEIFFTATSNVSKTVCEGLTKMLLHGPQRYADLPAEETLRQELARLYDKRSRATHGGQHAHVTQTDCEKLTQWICWMMANMATFGICRCTTVDAAHESLDRHRQAKR